MYAITFSQKPVDVRILVVGEVALDLARLCFHYEVGVFFLYLRRFF